MQQNVVEKCHAQMSSFQALPPRNPLLRRRRQKTTYTSSLSIAGCGVGPEKGRGKGGKWGKTGKIAGRSGKSKQGEQSLPLYSLLPRNYIVETKFLEPIFKPNPIKMQVDFIRLYKKYLIN